MEIVVFVLLGCVSGFSAGLLGIGGGLITVPAMLFLLPVFNLPDAQIMHIAVATSLAAIIPTSLLSAWGHHKHRAINWAFVQRMMPGLFLGAMFGAIVATFIAKDQLQMLFGLFLFLVAYKMFRSSDVPATRNVNPLHAFLISPVIGFISALLGVGGGTMTVPFLRWQGVAMRVAVGSSALCGLPIAIAASIAFANVHWVNYDGFQNQLIHLPALLGISLGSLLCVKFGVKAAHRLPVGKLKLLFSLLLLSIGIKLVFF